MGTHVNTYAGAAYQRLWWVTAVGYPSTARRALHLHACLHLPHHCSTLQPPPRSYHFAAFETGHR